MGIFIPHSSGVYGEERGINICKINFKSESLLKLMKIIMKRCMGFCTPGLSQWKTDKPVRERIIWNIFHGQRSYIKGLLLFWISVGVTIFIPLSGIITKHLGIELFFF